MSNARILSPNISLVEFLGYLYQRAYGRKMSPYQEELLRAIEAVNDVRFTWITCRSRPDWRWLEREHKRALLSITPKAPHDEGRGPAL